MKKNLLILLFAAVVLLNAITGSQTNDAKNGKKVHYYANGQKKFEIDYRNGKIQGTFTRWYENGKKMRESGFLEGRFHGKDTFWTPDGKISFKKEYINGQKHGKWQSWHPNGKNAGAGTFDNGTGTWTQFYENGGKKSVARFKDGKPDGEQAQWYADGRKKSVNTWKNGVRENKWSWWYADGSLAKEITWKNGRPVRTPAPGKNKQKDRAKTDLKKAIEEIVTANSNLHRNISVMVGVILKGKRQVFPFGKKSAAHPSPPDANTVYEIGSISKTFTAILLAQLHLEGRVKLDDRAGKYLPDIVTMPTFENKHITLRHLAAHTSALPPMAPNYEDHIVDHGDMFSTYTRWDLYDFLNNTTLERAIGEKYMYSNIGGGLLGHILGRAYGPGYETLLKQKLLDVLGMTGSTLVLTEKQKKNIATGHDRFGQATPNWHFQDCLQGSGAIKSSLNDMFIYLEANMGLKDTPLKAAIELSHQPVVKTPWGEDGGLAWGTLPDGDLNITWHNGATGGYRAFIGFDKKMKIGVIVLTNSRNTGMDDIGFGLIKILPQY